MTTKQQSREVTISVSEPYTVIGANGRMYPGQRRDYKAEVFGSDYQNTSKTEIERVIRARFFRETGRNLVRFTYVQEG